MDNLRVAINRLLLTAPPPPVEPLSAARPAAAPASQTVGTPAVSASSQTSRAPSTRSFIPSASSSDASHLSASPVPLPLQAPALRVMGQAREPSAVAAVLVPLLALL